MFIYFFKEYCIYIKSFKEYFEVIGDGRQSEKVTYSLFDILFGSLYSVIVGAKGWFDIRQYIVSIRQLFQKHDMFVEYLPLDDTIARIISSIEPKRFHQSFLTWMENTEIVYLHYFKFFPRNSKRAN